jgi:hypothetical protein
MFSNAREAQLLLWHVQQKRDGKIRHLADGRQWKQFNLSYTIPRKRERRLHTCAQDVQITRIVTI